MNFQIGLLFHTADEEYNPASLYDILNHIWQNSCKWHVMLAHLFRIINTIPLVQQNRTLKSKENKTNLIKTHTIQI